MGREYRLQGNARVREKSDRRTTRISAFVPAECVRIVVLRDAAIVGIDVGENFLDLAIIGAGRRSLRYERVALVEIGGANPIEMLSDALARAVPELRAGAIAIVDSPRSALDLDCSTTGFTWRQNPPKTREVDTELRALVRRLNENPAREDKLRLSLFPSRVAKYFFDCAFHPECKPHLKALGSHMFKGLAGEQIANPAKLSGGALFTRFMIAGFATYQALKKLGAERYEGYPYLAFRLWMKPGEKLMPKKDKSKALVVRQAILKRLAMLTSIEMPAPHTLDQADAAILAITLARASSTLGVIAQIECPPEGCFIVALDEIDSAWFSSSACLRIEWLDKCGSKQVERD